VSRFNSDDFRECVALFQSKKSTKEVQCHLMDKYKLEKISNTSNFIKKVRKTMGIYSKKSGSSM
jgi:hypothetical protein